MNTVDTIADIAIKKNGETEFPSRFSADAITDSTYDPIPMIASVLFFILFY